METLQSLSFGMSPAVVAALVAALALLVVFFVAVLPNSLVYIANTEYGIVERKWGATRDLRFAPMALASGLGFLPEVLAGGFHVLAPFKYRVHRNARITIDGLAYLVARVGSPLNEGQALGEWPPGIAIDDARGFLANGGQRGPQRRILRSGTYAPNLALFCVVTDGAIHKLGVGNDRDDRALQAQLAERQAFDPVVISDDTIGIVTVQDGPGLQHGEIVAPTVGTDPSRPETFHNSFQDTSRFLAAGGRRGRQEQVLVDGTYFINRLFATVEPKPKTKVEIGTVSVVNSYVGEMSVDAMTADGGRGKTVPVGSKGIWERPLDPGKYPLNPYAMEVVSVPTTNFQLRWIFGSTGGTSFDLDLREIPVITRDAFEILLPLSVVAHIAPMDAPSVIQRFSDVRRLVTTTLDPLVSAYFKDASQSRTLLEFIQDRQAIQSNALDEMRKRLAQHRVGIEEVLLGTPVAPAGDDQMERMLAQLRARQLAHEQIATFKSQELAATTERSLNEQQALTAQQAALTASIIAIRVAENQGEAEASRQSKLAVGIRATAEAEAYGARVRAEAIGGVDGLLRQLALETLGAAIRESKSPLVPGVLVEGGAGQGGNLIGMLLALAAADPSRASARSSGT